MSAKTEFTVEKVRRLLGEKVSSYNANLMLRSAILTSGLSRAEDEKLDTEEIKALSMALINRGGPSFQVGRSILSSLQ